ncbi:hypothetical protein NQ176_g11183 [Zarea fungicola]|uniref:Uncharacterized protein n=1 Tax=Zarea fungicola TaxID=93591 RepID=A0ACC1MBM1_9HYPO|nr:hypothetical protein NQ176_g11183 [Lecanicillium fungicola]
MVRKSLYAKGAQDDATHPETHRQQSKPVDESDAAITPTDNKTEDVSIDGAPSSSKKRKVAAGGRGVANLTPDQLAKKRANDREAQRAIRERTKTQIQTLERRIKELTSMEPIQELQAALDAKKEVERENAEIRKQLASIVAILQPMIGGQLPDSSAASAEQEPPNVKTPTGRQQVGRHHLEQCAPGL